MPVGSVARWYARLPSTILSPPPGAALHGHFRASVTATPQLHYALLGTGIFPRLRWRRAGQGRDARGGKGPPSLIPVKMPHGIPEPLVSNLAGWRCFGSSLCAGCCPLPHLISNADATVEQLAAWWSDNWMHHSPQQALAGTLAVSAKSASDNPGSPNPMGASEPHDRMEAIPTDPKANVQAATTKDDATAETQVCVRIPWP